MLPSTEYHKIDSVFKRDPKTGAFLPEFSRKEFGYLVNNLWHYEEKIDGTNIRITFIPGSTYVMDVVQIQGRTDRAQIIPELKQVLESRFTKETLRDTFPDASSETRIVLYGEGVGPKINDSRAVFPDRYDFVLFDVRIGHWWLVRENVFDIAQKLNTLMAPAHGWGSLREAEARVRDGIRSKFSIPRFPVDAEGLILRPAVDLLDRAGRRLITKLKTKDFLK